MMKAVIRNAKGEPTTFLGLTPDNIEQLKDNKPILIDLSKLGLPHGHVVLMYGQDLGEIQDDLRSMGVPIPEDAPRQMRSGESFIRRND